MAVQPLQITLSTEKLLELNQTVANINANSAALLALGAGVVPPDVVMHLVKLDFEHLQAYANEFFTLGQQQNNTVSATNMNVVVDLTFNSANLATTPITYVTSLGTTPVDVPSVDRVH